MKTKLNYKRFNNEDFLEMASFATKEEAQNKAGAYRSKYGRARVAKRKDGMYCIYCCQ